MICPICGFASKIMDNIIYISQIKWSKAREHAEHMCCIAGPAILSIKHAYRINISWRVWHHKMAKGLFRYSFTDRSHLSNTTDFKNSTYTKGLLKTLPPPQQKLHLSLGELVPSQVFCYRIGLCSKARGTACAGKETWKTRNYMLSCRTTYWAVILSSLEMLSLRKLTWNKDWIQYSVSSQYLQM